MPADAVAPSAATSELRFSDIACELCAGDGGEVLWRDQRCRVVYVDEPGYPGYCRVIWNAHVGEMTDLSGTERAHLMDVVLAAEAVLRELLRPEKMNLASFGSSPPAPGRL